MTRQHRQKLNRSEQADWLRLIRSENVGPITFFHLLQYYGSAGAALDAYRLDNGRYPTTAQGLEALYTLPTAEPRPTNWRGPYLRKRVPVDPWTNPYIFESPGKVNTTGYDLISLGADGAPGGEGEDADIAG